MISGSSGPALAVQWNVTKFLKLFKVLKFKIKVLKFKIESKIQNAAHKMDSHDPDLAAIEANL